MTTANGPSLNWGGLTLGTKEISRTIDGDTLVVEYNEGDACEHGDAEKGQHRLRACVGTEVVMPEVETSSPKSIKRKPEVLINWFEVVKGKLVLRVKKSRPKW